MVDDNAGDRTVAEHEAIYAALVAHDAPLAAAAALMHVSTTEQWLREHLHHSPMTQVARAGQVEAAGS